MLPVLPVCVPAPPGVFLPVNVCAFLRVPLLRDVYQIFANVGRTSTQTMPRWRWTRRVCRNIYHPTHKYMMNHDPDERWAAWDGGRRGRGGRVVKHRYTAINGIIRGPPARPRRTSPKGFCKNGPDLATVYTTVPHPPSASLLRAYTAALPPREVCKRIRALKSPASQSHWFGFSRGQPPRQHGWPRDPYQTRAQREDCCRNRRRKA